MNSEFLSLETAQKLAYNEKINELYNKIDNQDKIINEQALEIARLKEKNSEKGFIYPIYRNKKYRNKKPLMVNDKAMLYIEDLEDKISMALELIRKALVETDITGNGTLNLNKLLEILGDKEIKEIPQFKRILEQLNNLSIIGGKE